MLYNDAMFRILTKRVFLEKEREKLERRLRILRHRDLILEEYLRAEREKISNGRSPDVFEVTV